METELLEDQDFAQRSAAWSALFVPEPVIKALVEMNFTQPTEIQSQTLPAAIQGKKDIVAAAETGSGKTLCFAIPIIDGILKEKARCDEDNSDEDDNDEDNGDEDDNDEDNSDEEMISEAESDDAATHSDSEEEPSSGGAHIVQHLGYEVVPKIEVIDSRYFQSFTKDEGNTAVGIRNNFKALILTPTRELAVQIKEHIDKITKHTTIKVAVVTGGLAQQKQERLLKRQPEIVIATPGRLWDLIQAGNPHLNQINNISYLVLDEADRMVERGHFEQVQNLLELLKSDEKTQKKRQFFVFSATLTLVHEMPNRAKRKFLKLTPEQKLRNLMEMIGMQRKPKVVDLTQENVVAATLTEAQVSCTTAEKDFYLYYFLMRYPGRTLVFCNSITCVRRLINLFKILECSPLHLHADMQQSQRLKHLDRFKKDSKSLLIATDVAARGLDIPYVDHVIHYQVPRTSESYVHRSGRTARASKEGLTVMLIDPSDARSYMNINKTLNRPQDVATFPVDELVMPVIKERVKLAQEIDVQGYRLKKKRTVRNSMHEMARKADILLDEDDFPEETEELHREQRQEKVIEKKKSQLKSMLKKQLPVKLVPGQLPTQQSKEEIKAQLLESLKTTKARFRFAKLPVKLKRLNKKDSKKGKRMQKKRR